MWVRTRGGGWSGAGGRGVEVGETGVLDRVHQSWGSSASGGCFLLSRVEIEMLDVGSELLWPWEKVVAFSLSLGRKRIFLD